MIKKNKVFNKKFYKGEALVKTPASRAYEPGDLDHYGLQLQTGHNLPTRRLHVINKTKVANQTERMNMHDGVK